MNLEGALVAWEETVKELHFQPWSWYGRAEQLVKQTDPDSAELSQLCEQLPVRFDNAERIFKKYGIFVSAVVNRMSVPDRTLVVPINKIDEFFKSKEARGSEEPGWLEHFGAKLSLDYLGFCHSKGTAIYDGNAGRAFGAHTQDGTVILTGNADSRALWKQSGGTGVLLKNAGTRANEEQTGGIGLIAGDATHSINKSKKNGTTYVMGSVKHRAGRDMEGGDLFVLRNAGDDYAEGLKGKAKIWIGGKIGKSSFDGRMGGDLTIKTLICPEMSEIYSRVLKIIGDAGLQ